MIVTPTVHLLHFPSKGGDERGREETCENQCECRTARPSHRIVSGVEYQRIAESVPPGEMPRFVAHTREVIASLAVFETTLEGPTLDAYSAEIAREHERGEHGDPLRVARSYGWQMPELR